MPRPTIKLEAYCPKTIWPLFVFESYLDAEAAGHKRSAILKVIKGHNREHHGLGWRLADSVSLLPAWVASHCVEDQRAEPGDCISVLLAQRLFAEWVGQAVEFGRIRDVLRSKYGLHSFVDQAVVRGLVFRGMQKAA